MAEVSPPRFDRSASARGMCNITTQRKIMTPVSVAASRAVLGTTMPTPPAINATPAKYVQKRRLGIHAGTSWVTKSA